jgi:hypothetical protein
MNPIDTPKPRFYIVNTFDRPSEDYIAELGGDGMLRYIHPKLKEEWKDQPMSTENATPLEAFGIMWDIKGGVFVGVTTQTSPVIAKYENGSDRKWQGSAIFTFDYSCFSQTKTLDTPRTNRETYTVEAWMKGTPVVHTIFAKELERELEETKLAWAAEKQPTLESLEAIHETGSELFDTLERELNLLRSALEACMEDSIELLEERDQWKDEHRGRYQQRYAKTETSIKRAKELLALP